VRGATLVADLAMHGIERTERIRHGKRGWPRGANKRRVGSMQEQDWDWEWAGGLLRQWIFVGVAIDGHGAARGRGGKTERAKDRRGDDKGVARHHRRGRGMESMRSKGGVGLGLGLRCKQADGGVHRLGWVYAVSSSRQTPVALACGFFASAKSECTRV